MKLQNVTPTKFLCVAGACPGLFKTDNDTVLVVGRRVAEEDVRAHLNGKVAQDECVVEIPLALLQSTMPLD